MSSLRYRSGGMRLLQTHCITFTRHGGDNDKTYIDEYGNSVAPTSTTEIPTQGSLQPYSRKTNRIALDEGMREEDFKVYYTKADLRTTEQFDNLTPDTCTIKNKEYKVLREGDWEGFGLIPDNREYYLQLIQPKGS